MKLKYLYILFIFSALTLDAQTLRAQEKSVVLPENETKEEPGFFEDYFKGYYSQVFGMDVTSIINLSLYSSIEKWIGTPYRYAGKSLSGIDCSAFVNKIYESTYCMFLQGNSAEMYKNVKHLPKDELTEGDLVFFKIRNNKISHIGIYLGQNKFVHSSTQNGVIVSDLDNPYYVKYFFKAGRIKS